MKIQSHIHSSEPRLPPNAQVTDVSVRQIAYDRNATYRPDSVIPGPIAKSELHRMRSMPTSPLSQSGEDSMCEVNEDVEHSSDDKEKVSSCESKSRVRVKAVVLKVKLVPFKKRDYLREIWKRRTCQLPDEDASTPT